MITIAVFNSLLVGYCAMFCSVAHVRMQARTHMHTHMHMHTLAHAPSKSKNIIVKMYFRQGSASMYVLDLT